MNFLDLAALALGASFTLLVFVSRTDIEKSRVRVKVRTRQ
jgi:hypothetical protein